MKTFRLRQLLLLVLAALMLGPLSAQAYHVRYYHVRHIHLAVFHTASTTKITVGKDPAASLSDLSIGDHVSIMYHHENGALVTDRITDAAPRRPHKTGKNDTVTPSQPDGTSSFKHLSGKIRALNVQAGTLTIAY